MIAIVPARGGSKGLPGKNIKKLNGKPLIAYTIEVALQSKYITDVIISTDDEDIYRIALEYGAKATFLRPKTLAEDSSIAIDTYIYTINRLEADFKYDIDSFVVLQPTSPLRAVSDVDGAVELFFTKKADSVISYCEEQHPVTWHKYINSDGKLESIFDIHALKNRQEIKSTYYPNGAIYVFKSSLIRSGQYYSRETYPYIMPRARSVDIDTLEDFEYANYLMAK